MNEQMEAFDLAERSPEQRAATALRHLDDALLKVNMAAIAISQGDVAARGQAISKAIEIITNCLKGNVGLNVGGDVAARLVALYDYMVSRLDYANQQMNESALKEVAGLLGELKNAWQAIHEEEALQR